MTGSAARMPVLIDDVTPEWLTAALRGGGHLPQGRVTGVRIERFGEGVGLMGQIARLHLEYEGAPGGAPASMVIKMSAPPGPNRQMAVDYRIYEKEVLFYERIADRVPLRTPARYYSAFDPETHDFALMLEDLAPAEAGSELSPPSDAQAMIAVRELAKFHAFWWDTDELKALDWIPYLSDPIWRQHVDFFAFCWPLWREQFGGQVSSYVIETAERLGTRIPQMLDALSEPPCTIIHMDYRLPNLFFGVEGSGFEFAVVDWQPYSRARGLYDLGYFMSQSLPTEQRRRIQDDVLHLYHETLLANGVKDYGFDRCFHDYRMGSMYTFLYSVGTVSIDLGNEHGRAYQRAITERHVAAIEDLRAGEVLPE